MPLFCAREAIRGSGKVDLCAPKIEMFFYALENLF